MGQHFQPHLFWSWRVWALQKEQIIANVVMFIPVGILAGWNWKCIGVIVGVGLSCVVEALQLVTARGLCEFDNVLHNTVGTIVGLCFFLTLKTILKHEHTNREEKSCSSKE